jgi:hypothetical protein
MTHSVNFSVTGVDDAARRTEQALAFLRGFVPGVQDMSVNVAISVYPVNFMEKLLPPDEPVQPIETPAATAKRTRAAKAAEPAPPAAPAPAPAPVEDADEALHGPSPENVTKDDLIALMNHVSGRHPKKSAGVREIMLGFGGARLADIPEANYGALHAALEAAL